jgi:hypothetical protein
VSRRRSASQPATLKRRSRPRPAGGQVTLPARWSSAALGPAAGQIQTRWGPVARRPCAPGLGLGRRCAPGLRCCRRHASGPARSRVPGLGRRRALVATQLAVRPLRRFGPDLRRDPDLARRGLRRTLGFQASYRVGRRSARRRDRPSIRFQAGSASGSQTRRRSSRRYVRGNARTAAPSRTPAPLLYLPALPSQ